MNALTSRTLVGRTYVRVVGRHVLFVCDELGPNGARCPWRRSVPDAGAIAPTLDDLRVHRDFEHRRIDPDSTIVQPEILTPELAEQLRKRRREILGTRVRSNGWRIFRRVALALGIILVLIALATTYGGSILTSANPVFTPPAGASAIPAPFVPPSPGVALTYKFVGPIHDGVVVTDPAMTGTAPVKLVVFMSVDFTAKGATAKCEILLGGHVVSTDTARAGHKGHCQYGHPAPVPSFSTEGPA